jgi:hypothetical protein
MAAATFDLWIMNADGTNQKQLTTDPQRGFCNPKISPDKPLYRLQLNAWSTAERLADEH